MKYQLLKLEYPNDALEPSIDEQTVIFHHDKHQQAYVDKLNIALDSEPTFDCNCSVGELISDLSKVPLSIRTAVKNNGGGVFNHEFFFAGLTPNKSLPCDRVDDAITKDFGSFDNLKAQLINCGMNCFGSGWAWLGVSPENKLVIASTANQDSPIMGVEQSNCDMIGILNFDVWEHAYYLKYQNRRQEFLESLLHIINWKRVCKRYCDAVDNKKWDI